MSFLPILSEDGCCVRLTFQALLITFFKVLFLSDTPLVPYCRDGFIFGLLSISFLLFDSSLFDPTAAPEGRYPGTCDAKDFLPRRIPLPSLHVNPTSSFCTTTVTSGLPGFLPLSLPLSIRLWRFFFFSRFGVDIRFVEA